MAASVAFAAVGRLLVSEFVVLSEAVFRRLGLRREALGLQVDLRREQFLARPDYCRSASRSAAFLPDRWVVVAVSESRQVQHQTRVRSSRFRPRAAVERSLPLAQRFSVGFPLQSFFRQVPRWRGLTQLVWQTTLSL